MNPYRMNGQKMIQEMIQSNCNDLHSDGWWYDIESEILIWLDAALWYHLMLNAEEEM